ncbi:hypothetical protein DFH27DRAFT_478192 [Peziza echinospora]|nr:hypothetical protein DFH27DRAFT_478192 [Peziza echinospora]
MPVRNGSGYGAWPPRARTSSVGAYGFESPSSHSEPGSSRPQRPTLPARAPSNTYAPQRHPQVAHNLHSINAQARHRSASTNRTPRRDPAAQYRAQEKAYVQRIRQDNANDSYFGDQGNSLFYADSETEDESPASEMHFDNDLYDADTLLLYGQDNMDPSPEELKIPENRERLEWHSMLSSVLRGDVVKQEKKRMIGSAQETESNTLKTELWLGLRAKICGRSLAAQRRVIEDGQSTVDEIIEEILHFQIHGRDVTEAIPRQQVQAIILRWEKCESFYPTAMAMSLVKPKVVSAAFIQSYDAIVSWHNVTAMISTELGILQCWVGNQELDFGKPAQIDANASSLADESSFLDRILKEDGLKSLVGESNMLKGISAVVGKAKKTLIENHDAFAKRHLPPYIEELLLLINFPTRLIEEIIRIRLKYARKIRDPATLMIDQLIKQFQAILELAVRIKQEYTGVLKPERGWNLPPCMDENFEHVVLEGLGFYFKLLNWKLSGNKNTFKEAEILENEWNFSNTIGRYIEGGDVEVAEQFSSLTSKLLTRLTSHFEKELQKVHPEQSGVEASKRYKQIMDSVRIRQRKLFRFTRVLSQRFENSTEYSVEKSKLRGLVDSLITSGHFLVYTASVEHEGVFLVADPSLYDRPHQINRIMRTCYHDDVTREDPSCPYVLIICPQDQLSWDGRILEVDMREPIVDIKPGRLRLVADGSQNRLALARNLFAHSTNHDLDILIEQRANLPRVNHELFKIKRTTYRLSNTIMDSVDTIRKQTEGLDCQELIQSCFVFATEFGQRSVLFMDNNRRAMNNLKLTRLAVDWVSFICDDCIASNRLTFRWAVVALEFAMLMTRGQNILSINHDDYALLQAKVAGCMALLIGHFDILGARSTIAAQAEQKRIEAMAGQMKKIDVGKQLDDEEAAKFIKEVWMKQLQELDDMRRSLEFQRQGIGRVLDDTDQTDRSLTTLSSSYSSVTLRWQQGAFLGGGTFGSVYAAMNLDSGYLMAVKEIRLQDPQYIPSIALAIREEMTVLEQMDHPNIVQYFGIEVHRDRVYLFMEFCSGGSLAGLLEHGRIEDETVIMIYTLQMLEGLAYLHEASIIHRDIKPENILLDHNGIIKYVDFGAAKVIAKQGKTRAATTPTTKLNSMTGTPMYMSPEVITGAPTGKQGSIDIWSLGCVVLEMATGRRPWANLDNEWAIMWNIASGHSPALPTPDQLSEAGIDFLKKCFARDPKLRPSAAELLQHEWILAIRNQVIEPAVTTPNSDTSSSSGR